MWLTEMVEVDDARVEALTPEAFRLVRWARGVPESFEFEPDVMSTTIQGECSPDAALRAMLLFILAMHSHRGSTYDAFIEVERVQALLEAVQAAERGEWDECAGSAVTEFEDEPMASIWYYGLVYVNGIEMHLWHDPCPMGEPITDDPARAASEARAQLPRIVRTICGLEGSR